MAKVKLEVEGGLEEAFAQIEQLNNSLDETKTAVGGVGASMTTVFKAIGDAVKRGSDEVKIGANSITAFRARIEGLRGMAAVIDVNTKAFKETTAEIKRLELEFTNMIRTAEGAGDLPAKSISGMRQQIALLEQQVQTLDLNDPFQSQQVELLVKQIRNLQFELAKAEGRVNEFGQRVKLGSQQAIGDFVQLTQGASASLIGLANLGVFDSAAEGAQNYQKAIQLVTVAEGARVVVMGLANAKTVALTAVTTAQTVAERIAAAIKKLFTAETVAQTTANNVFTISQLRAAAAVRAFTAAMASNPIGAIIIAVLALVSALAFFSSEAEEAAAAQKKLSDEYDRFLSSLDRSKDRFDRALEADKAIAQASRASAEELMAIERTQVLNVDLMEREKLIAVRSRIAQIKIAMKEAEDEELEALKEELARRQEQEDAIVDLRAQTLDKLRIIDAQYQAELRTFTDRIAALQAGAVVGTRNRDIAQIRAQLQQSLAEVNSTSKEANDLRAALQADAERRIAKIIKDSDKAILDSKRAIFDALKGLEDKYNQGRIDNATGNQLIELEREQAVTALNEFKESLQKKGQAELDAIAEITGKRAQTFAFTAKQEEQFQALLFNIDKAAFDKRLKLQEQQRDAVLNLFGTEREQAIASFTDNFDEQAKLLLQGLDKNSEQFKVKSQQLTTQRELGIAAINTKFDLEELKREEQTQIDIINQKERGGENEKTFEKLKQAAILQTKIEFAEKSLALLKLDTSAEGQARVESLRAVIKQLKDELATLTASAAPVDLFDLLGIKDDEMKAAISSALTAFVDLQSQILSAEKQANDERIAENDRLLESIQDRIDQTEKEIERENNLNAKGLANDLNGKKKQLAALKEEERKALAEKAKLLEQDRKIKREQAILEAASQAANLATATTNIFVSATKAANPIAGVILAIAAVAAMIAGFLSIKNQINAATKLERGGTVGGRPHTEGGTKYVATDGSARVVELEDEEEVTNKRSAKKYRPLLKAINADRFDSLTTRDIMPLLVGTGVTVREEKATQMMSNTFEVRTIREEKIVNVRMKELEEKLDRSNKYLSVIEAELSKEQVTIMPDGTKILQHKNTTRIIKP